jgi:hypothetical protein
VGQANNKGKKNCMGKNNKLDIHVFGMNRKKRMEERSIGAGAARRANFGVFWS